MKILYIITGLSIGGAERALGNLLAGGLAARHDCVVLSLSYAGSMGADIRALGVPVETLGLRAGLPGPGAPMRLRRLVRAIRPDLIQGWMYHGNLAASLARALAPERPALAWNIRQSLYDPGKEKRLTRQVIRAGRALSSCPEAIIYNASLSRAQHEAFGFAAAPGIVIPNGFDLDRLRPDETAAAAVRDELGFAQDQLVVGHVARFHPMKDHAGFLRAAVAVAQQVPAARFLLVGRDVGPENPALAGLVPAALTERFTFVGERRDVQRLMQTMNVFCLSSSWSEAFPNVLAEAMACGVPCVTTDVGDSAAIVGDTGLVVPPSEPEALARALIAMLQTPATERRALGRAARARVAQNYSINAIVDRYDRFYKNLSCKARQVMTATAKGRS